MAKHNLSEYFPHDLVKLKRTAQVVLPKDFGAIVAYTGINKNSIVAEAGTGSGYMAVQLARVAKKVYSYELREDHYIMASKNFQKLGLKNVILVNASIEQISQDDLDLIFLDFKGSDTYIEKIRDHLKEGGYLVGYCPNIEQVKSFHLRCKEFFSTVFTITSNTVHYVIRDFGCRPEQFGLMHTAYLTFAKK